MIWITLILMLLFVSWPMTLLGVIGFLISDVVGLAVGLTLGLLWSMVLE